MLNFLCVFVLFNAVKADKKINIAQYGDFFSLLNLGWTSGFQARDD